MINSIRSYIVYLLTGIFGKAVFMLIFHDHIGEMSIGNALAVLWHGMRLDLAVAAYLTVIPLLIGLLRIWTRARWTLYFRRAYTAMASLAFATALTANIALYEYWGFPLDSTPLFYVLTSPSDAAASVSLLQLIGFVMVILLCSAILFIAIERECKIFEHKGTNDSTASKVRYSIVHVILMALLFIPIRGGLTTVAVNNVGSVYFSDNIRLNHAAVNPVFSFIESVSHDEDFANKYRFMDDSEAARLMSEMIYTKMRTSGDSLLTHKPQRVVLVILESFSSYIMTERGNVKGVTPTIDRLADDGLYFTRIYANSFRTDRGLMSILSGYPAQPTMSLMKYPKKTNDLYSIARSLRREGYTCRYIYGGDANFTNMRSYLKATGYSDIVSEEDYPASLRTGKWGVNDSVMFDRAMDIITSSRNEPQSFYTIQTSSSHEPFDVPHHALKDERLNAFHYTDQQLGRFIQQLRDAKMWDNTLVVIVPDHLGCYPRNIDNMQLYRYQIPLIMTGGVITKPCRINTIGSQHDIAATLLTLLGIDHGEFTYSKDLLDPASPHFAFFCVPDAMGMVTDENQIIYDNQSGKVMLDQGKRSANLRKAQAYLQKIYDDIAGK